MASLTISTMAAGSTRLKLVDVSAEQGYKHRMDAASALGETLSSMDVLMPPENESAGDSSLPNMTLSDVLEHQDVVLISSDDTNTDTATLIVAVDVTESLAGAVETTFVSGADIHALYTDALLDLQGTSSQTPTSNVLLLKNGWAYIALNRSPLDLPTEPQPDVGGEHWSPWRQSEDGVHEIQDLATGLWAALAGTLVDTSPKSLEETSGAYRSTQVSSTFGQASTTWRNLELSPDGFFSVSTSTLISGGHDHPDNSFILEVTRSVSQRSRTFSGVALSEEGAAAHVGFQQEQLSEHVGDLFGSWEILEDGVTLELRFADGRVERRLFLQPQENGALSIDGDRWWRNADAAPDLLQRLFDILTNPDNAQEGASWASILARVERQLNRNREAQSVEVQGNSGSAAGQGVSPGA